MYVKSLLVQYYCSAKGKKGNKSITKCEIKCPIEHVKLMVYMENIDSIVLICNNLE